MKKWLFIILFSIPSLGRSQSVSKIEATKTVFINLVQAYANGKGSPELEIVPLNEIQVIAEYHTTKEGNPKIKIDQKLINICFSLGKDSINTLAFILSHELSHYYRDDNWCLDYAGLKSKTNLAFAKAMKIASKSNEKEAIADKEGLLHAAIAGYSPFVVFNELIDVIYEKYKLQENLIGYPTKAQRKEINNDAKFDALKWLSVFDVGTILTYIGKYQEAIDCFNFLSKKFPSREVFNNCGTAQLLWALEIKPAASIEYIYPIEIDPQSRLNISLNSNRGSENNQNFQELLSKALENFEKAKQIDNKYKKVYINLACVHELLENYDLALGYSKKINQGDLEYKSAIEIRAIAFVHQNRIEDANNSFLEIQKLYTDTVNYNYKMFLLGNENLINAEKFKNHWLNYKLIDSSSIQNMLFQIEKNKNISKSEKLKTDIIGDLIHTINCNYSYEFSDYEIITKKEKLHFFRYFNLADDTNNIYCQLNELKNQEKVLIKFKKNNKSIYKIKDH
jgi:tetratricopeptide (TPR) repeat protein